VTLSIADVSVAEGDAGTTNAIFVVSTGAPSNQIVTVHYATAGGSATSGVDFQPASGTLTFQPGETSKQLPIVVIGDAIYEADETFTVTLSNPTGGAILARAQATGTIRNDDAQSQCAPRPPVQIRTAIVAGKLQVTVSTTALNSHDQNTLSELRFGQLRNARVTVDGQVMASGKTRVMDTDTSTVVFTVERAVPGQPVTVPFTVVDSCGEWPTFVGGGTASGF
jgi:hypothetical protein